MNSLHPTECLNDFVHYYTKYFTYVTFGPLSTLHSTFTHNIKIVATELQQHGISSEVVWRTLFQKNTHYLLIKSGYLPQAPQRSSVQVKNPIMMTYCVLPPHVHFQRQLKLNSTDIHVLLTHMHMLGKES